MKLGRILDLDKFTYNKNHWTHPDLKENQLYIVKIEDYGWTLGTFYFWTEPYATKWNFNPSMSSLSPQLSYGNNPAEDGWLHIQEVID